MVITFTLLVCLLFTSTIAVNTLRTALCIPFKNMYLPLRLLVHKLVNGHAIRLEPCQLWIVLLQSLCQMADNAQA